MLEGTRMWGDGDGAVRERGHVGTVMVMLGDGGVEGWGQGRNGDPC